MKVFSRPFTLPPLFHLLECAKITVRRSPMRPDSEPWSCLILTKKMVSSTFNQEATTIPSLTSRNLSNLLYVCSRKWTSETLFRVFIISHSLVRCFLIWVIITPPCNQCTADKLTWHFVSSFNLPLSSIFRHSLDTDFQGKPLHRLPRPKDVTILYPLSEHIPISTPRPDDT